MKLFKEFISEAKSAAWQRKEGKNKKGGLNEKGRKSYERENPGSDLKAPQPEGGPRKRSFCARMGGVKGPMKKPNGEPTRKALALRKWKCSEEVTSEEMVGNAVGSSGGFSSSADAKGPVAGYDKPMNKKPKKRYATGGHGSRKRWMNGK